MCICLHWYFWNFLYSAPLYIPSDNSMSPLTISLRKQRLLLMGDLPGTLGRVQTTQLRKFPGKFPEKSMHKSPAYMRIYVTLVITSTYNDAYTLPIPN